MGVTFKENCPDIRNTRVVDIVDELQAFGCNVEIYDPWADQKEVKQEYGIQKMDIDVDIYNKTYNAIILAVSHEQFLKLDYKKLSKGNNAVLFDIKGVLPRDIVDGRL